MEKVRTVGHAALAIKTVSGDITYVSFWPDSRRGRDDNGLWHSKWQTFRQDFANEGGYPNDVVVLGASDVYSYFGRIATLCIEDGLRRFEDLKGNPPPYHAK